jgi:hypothetical protein
MSRDDPNDAGQRALATEFARLAALLRGEARVAVAPAPRAQHLAERFGLSRFERDLLLCLAGIEIDGAVNAAAGGGLSFARALEMLPAAHWSAIGVEGPLRRWRLIELDAAAPLTSAALRIDERVLHHLIGLAAIDPRLHGLVRRAVDAPMLAPAQAALADELRAQLEGSAIRPALCLSGDDPDGMAGIAAAIAPARIEIHADLLPAAATELATVALLIDREAKLSDAVPLLVTSGAMPEPALRLADRIETAPILIARTPAALGRPSLRRRVERPSPTERLDLWRRHAPALGESDAAMIAATYGLSAEAIAAEAALDPEALALDQACRSRGGARLDALAARLPHGPNLDDLVLPPAVRATLDTLVAQMRLRPALRLAWDGKDATGIAALFAGDSGTGKTMAARAVAGALGLDIHRIDLAMTVSKYIGETEKNLRTLFDAAEESGAVLLFDEADALFGKRSEVRDAHDRYSNIEIGYLLQRLETYSGLAILTTNMRHALDPAFQRRLRFVISFPFPDASARAAIWRGAFPAGVDTTQLDFERLARLEAAGGAIRVIALNAAFAAADEGGPVEMRHLLAAARADAAKRERPLSDSETRGWA